jgi:hypothetical protein
VDVHTEVRGQGRRGVRLSRLIATVRTVMRVPMRQRRQGVLRLHGGEVRMGAIVGVLHRISTHVHPLLDDLTATIRARSAVHADETGWRCDCLNGEIWSVRPPTLRSDESHHSRAGDVVTPVRGDTFQGVLGRDVSAGDTISQGCHHRWWVHSGRDIHTRKDTDPDDEEVWTWANAVTDVSGYAVAWVAQEFDPSCSPRQLPQRRVVFSGYVYREREDVNAMRERYRSGKIQGVIIRTLGRLSRSQVHHALLMEEMEYHKVVLYCVKENIDETPMGTFIRMVLAFVAEMEREKILDRATTGRMHKTRQGKIVSSSQAPYGWK